MFLEVGMSKRTASEFEGDEESLSPNPRHAVDVAAKGQGVGWFGKSKSARKSTEDFDGRGQP
jgi:hypothetical protein